MAGRQPGQLQPAGMGHGSGTANTGRWHAQPADAARYGTGQQYGLRSTLCVRTYRCHVGGNLYGFVLMTFIERIKQASPVWRRWHGERRVGGVLLGVQFAWEPGNVYRSLPLSTEQIAQLMTLDSIDFEAVSI